jgi:predicted nucleotidyltransferase
MVLRTLSPVDPYTARYGAHKRIPLRQIRAVAKRIADQFHPDKIILFGSYAYGQPKPWSDVDLLLVMDTPLTSNKQRHTISEFLRPQPFSIDLIIWSAEKLEERIAGCDWFLQEVVERGKVIYDKNWETQRTKAVARNNRRMGAKGRV